MFEKGNWKRDAADFYNQNFYAKNDAGHKIDHAYDVYLEMLRLNKSLELNLDEDMIFMTAFTHDLFIHEGRQFHHNAAMNYVVASSDPFLDNFDPDQLWVIGQAVNEHRASGKDHYSNDYSRIIRLADKGVPDLNKIIMRGYTSNKHKHDGLTDEMAIEVLDHLVKKFGRDGYGFKSVDYRKVYGHELEDFWLDLDGINIDEWIRRVKLGLNNELCFK